MSNDTRVPKEGHIILPSKKKQLKCLESWKRKKSLTQSVFELQKSFSTQNSSPDNFRNILLNKLLHRRPLTLIFSNPNMQNSCWQLKKKTIVTWSVFELQKSFNPSPLTIVWKVGFQFSHQPEFGTHLNFQPLKILHFSKQT